MTVRPGTVEDVIERNTSTVAGRLGIQVRAAWRHFGADAPADTIARRHRGTGAGDDGAGVGQAPVPVPGSTGLALILARVTALESGRGSSRGGTVGG
ncbi:hypothetical protein ACWEFL_32410 [Streptomyces sp. NPDC004838]